MVFSSFLISLGFFFSLIRWLKRWVMIFKKKPMKNLNQMQQSQKNNWIILILSPSINKLSQCPWKHHTTYHSVASVLMLVHHWCEILASFIWRPRRQWLHPLTSNGSSQRCASKGNWTRSGCRHRANEQPTLGACPFPSIRNQQHSSRHPHKPKGEIAYEANFWLRQCITRASDTSGPLILSSPLPRHKTSKSQVQFSKTRSIFWETSQRSEVPFQGLWIGHQGCWLVSLQGWYLGQLNPPPHPFSP